MITGCISASCNCMIIGAFFFLAWLGGAIFLAGRYHASRVEHIAHCLDWIDL
jgi:hypothetical protein